MKAKFVPILWGVVLVVLGGGLLIATSLGIVSFKLDNLSDTVWIIILGVLSILFFLSYFMTGVQNWGWLFPACICTALALTVWMTILGTSGAALGAPILASVALPFYVGFALDRKSVGLLFPAIILTALMLVTLVVDTGRGEWIASLVLYAIAIPFLVNFLADRSKRWALIPAGILGVIGTIPLLTIVTTDPSGAIMMLFALLFFVIYFLSQKNWWALIPAGVFASIGVVNILSRYVSKPGQDFDPIMSGILLLGFALTFTLLWLRRKFHPTDWAKYPALGLAILALLTFIIGENVINSWPVVLLIVGIIILATSLWPRREAIPPKTEEQ